MSKESQWLLNEKYGGKETPEYFADLKRLEAGEPLAYVIGWVDFLGCRIDISLRPLIPRPETEFWVEKVIKSVASKQLPVASLKILDLFAGSGCIGIALLKHLPNARVDFGEKDEKLCAQIRKNLNQNGVAARARVIRTDVFSNIQDSYNIIVANPPYISPNKKDTVQESVLAHEPHEALFADDDGLFFIKKLLKEAPAHLHPGGVMYIEFGEAQKEQIEKLTKSEAWETEFWKDQFGKWRVVKLSRS